MIVGTRRCLYSIALGTLLIGCGGDDGTNGSNGTDGTSGTNGANGAVSLIKTTQLPTGDANCPAGGTQIDSGLDNGDGGGTAGNNTLESGEIDDTQRICASASSTQVGSFTAPEGAEGTYFIKSNGGAATAAGGVGGDGGPIEMYHSYGTNGGHIKLFKTGQVDASFDVPAAPATSDYGDTPLVVSSGTTHVKRVTDLTDTTDVDSVALTAGDIVQPFSSGCNLYYLYRWNSTASQDIITGVHVQAGATLTFDHAINSTDSCVYHYTYVDKTVRNEGTISAGRDSNGNADSIVFYLGSYFGATGSSFIATGANGSGVVGGNGGYLQIRASMQPNYVGGILNYGTVDTSGGSGTDGGSAGGMYFRADNQLINTGAINSRGGDATNAAGTAGSGYYIDLESRYGLFANSATLDSSGGSGGTVGGNGGYIYLNNYEYGDLRNTGELRAIGGTPAAGCGASCQGGNGGYVYIYAYGDLHNAANISTYGASGLTGAGGSGNDIEFYTEYGSALATGEDNSTHGSIAVSGNLDSHGGDGTTTAGSGGSVDTYTYFYYTPAGQEIVFYGYGGGIDASGGAGDAQGGNAGQYFYLGQSYGYSQSGNYTPGGGIVNDLNVNFKGGNAANGNGGNGGYFWETTYDTNYGSSGFERVINRGNLDVSGGNGTTSGGAASYVFLFGLDGAENHGNITANSGSATAAAGNGGSCQNYEYSSEGSHGISIVSDNGLAVNTGNLSDLGGNATAAGGNGGDSSGILVFGYTTENSGTLATDGGDGDTATGTGGDGGAITIRAYGDVSTNTASSMTSTGGAGAEGFEGAAGLISVDGQLL